MNLTEKTIYYYDVYYNDHLLAMSDKANNYIFDNEHDADIAAKAEIRCRIENDNLDFCVQHSRFMTSEEREKLKTKYTYIVSNFTLPMEVLCK